MSDSRFNGVVFLDVRPGQWHGSGPILFGSGPSGGFGSLRHGCDGRIHISIVQFWIPSARPASLQSRRDQCVLHEAWRHGSLSPIPVNS